MQSSLEFARPFGQFNALLSLEMFTCKALEGSPDSFGKLKALQTSDLRLEIESLPNHFGQLKALQAVDLILFEAFKSLPDPFRQFNALQLWELIASNALEGLPDSSGQLKAPQALTCQCAKHWKVCQTPSDS